MIEPLNIEELRKRLLSEKKELILPVVPLRDLVVFPHQIIPLYVGRPFSVEAVKQALM